MHLDATIRLFAPEYEPNTIRSKAIRRSNGWFELGEVRQLVFNVPRRAARVDADVAAIARHTILGARRFSPSGTFQRFFMVRSRLARAIMSKPEASP
jgi:hypothetical protein